MYVFFKRKGSALIYTLKVLFKITMALIEWSGNSQLLLSIFGKLHGTRKLVYVSYIDRHIHISSPLNVDCHINVIFQLLLSLILLAFPSAPLITVSITLLYTLKILHFHLVVCLCITIVI